MNKGMLSQFGRGYLRPAIMFVLAASAAGIVAAQGIPGWSFSASSGLEILYGTGYEYVLDPYTGGKVSELDWGIDPIVALSSSASARWRDTEFSLSCAAGIPGNSGIITDSDWLNEGTGYTNRKTNYSESSAVSERLIDLSLTLGQVFEPSYGSSLKLFAGYRYFDIAWSAHGGWLQYADNITNANPPYDPYTTGPKTTLYGLLSTYEQQYTAVIVGLSGNFKLSSRFAIEGSVQFSPAVYCTAVDNHILRSVTFTDTMSGGLLFEPELAFDWTPTRVFGLSLSVKYTSISGLKGDDVETGNTGVTGEAVGEGQSITYPNSAGAALNALGVGLSAMLYI